MVFVYALYNPKFVLPQVLPWLFVLKQANTIIPALKNIYMFQIAKIILNMKIKFTT